MRDLNVITANYDGAVTGYPEGSFRNNPGDNTGSGVMAAMGNDLWYGMSAMIYKYLGDKNGNAEMTTTSDFLNAIEAMIGAYDSGISNWLSATDYSTAGMVSVMRYGVQFTSILATGNVNKDPVTNPTFWIPTPSARELFIAHSEGRVIAGGSLSLHDHTNTGYKQYFSLGTHRLNGFGSSGYAFHAWGVHLDGTGVGTGDLSAIVEAWHLKDTFAPGSLGSRTLQDAKGRVLRMMDAASGRADLIGEVLADQMQGHDTKFGISIAGGTTKGLRINATGLTLGFNDLGTLNGTASCNPPESDGTNGTPRTGSVTADKSITVGVPYMVICVPA